MNSLKQIKKIYNERLETIQHRTGRYARLRAKELVEKIARCVEIKDVLFGNGTWWVKGSVRMIDEDGDAFDCDICDLFSWARGKMKGGKELLLSPAVAPTWRELRWILEFERLLDWCNESNMEFSWEDKI